MYRYVLTIDKYDTYGTVQYTKKEISNFYMNKGGNKSESIYILSSALCMNF